jgi:hypothetical protein
VLIKKRQTTYSHDSQAHQRGYCQIMSACGGHWENRVGDGEEEEEDHGGKSEPAHKVDIES